MSEFHQKLFGGLPFRELWSRIAVLSYKLELHSCVMPAEFPGRSQEVSFARELPLLSARVNMFFRPDIERLSGYVPGEQPQAGRWVKLNTNENPYPPSPQVVEAIQKGATGPLNLYPDPLGTAFRDVAANLFGLERDWILPGNGSDEVLTILTRSFAGEGQIVAYPYPSYILYETLGEIQGAKPQRLPLGPDWNWNSHDVARFLRDAKLVYVPNPNSPSGHRWSQEEILSLVPPNGILVLDEAYGDFADTPHQGEILKSPLGKQIVITRTLSKSYSLAGIRFGFAVAHPELIAGMRKVKDSYNCDTLSLAAATAALTDQAWMKSNVARILATRAVLVDALEKLGFDVIPSQTNFVWATHQTHIHRELYDALRQHQILVRYMVYRDVPWAKPQTGLPAGTLDGLRITVGKDEEIARLLRALNQIVRTGSERE